MWTTDCIRYRSCLLLVVFVLVNDVYTDNFGKKIFDSLMCLLSLQSTVACTCVCVCIWAHLISKLRRITRSSGESVRCTGVVLMENSYWNPIHSSGIGSCVCDYIRINWLTLNSFGQLFHFVFYSLFFHSSFCFFFVSVFAIAYANIIVVQARIRWICSVSRAIILSSMRNVQFASIKCEEICSSDENPNIKQSANSNN